MDAQSENEHIQRVLQIMTTEHYNLQSVRSGTISEANGRASIFLVSVSSSIVALGFFAQVSSGGQAFVIFASVLFSAMLFIGLVTYARLCQIAGEDATCLVGINRIRDYYLELAPEMKEYLVLSSHDDARGMRLVSSSLWLQLFLSTPGMIAVINSFIAGTLAGLLVEALLGLSLAVSVIAGFAVLVLAFLLHSVYQRARINEWRRGVNPDSPMRLHT